MDSDNINFREFEELISKGAEEIALTEDVLLENSEEEDYKAGIEISADSLIIDGNGHTIDGNRKTPLLNVNASRVTLKNIIFKNGFSDCSGGAIINNGDLTIESCEFLDNTSDEYGGAIYNNSKLLIKDSSFMENRADYGGAVYIDSDSVLNLKSSFFKSNSSEFEGGAIYNKAKLAIDNSSFIDNASFKGGAIYNELILDVKNSNFKNNIASDGDHIESESNENLTISDCIFD